MLENSYTGTIAWIISLLPLSRLLTQMNFVSYPADTPLEHNPKQWNRWRRWIICFHGSAQHCRVCYHIFPRSFSHVEAVFVFLPPAFRIRTPCFKCPRLHTSCQIHARTGGLHEIMLDTLDTFFLESRAPFSLTRCSSYLPSLHTHVPFLLPHHYQPQRQRNRHRYRPTPDSWYDLSCIPVVSHSSLWSVAAQTARQLVRRKTVAKNREKKYRGKILNLKQKYCKSYIFWRGEINNSGLHRHFK